MAVGSNLHADTAAHGLALDGCNVAHQLQQVTALHLKHDKVVLERRYEHDVAAPDNALGHIVAQAAHIGKPHVGRLQPRGCAALDHHVRCPVAQQTLGTLR